MEQRIEQFNEMLIEKKVSAYSTWEKELQKIVFDPRYLLLTSKERKQVFERYVRDRAAEESRERASVLKRKKEQFRDLCKEANVTLKSNFTDFSSKHGRDDRFKGIEKPKERESLFNDYQSDLRKQEKEEKYAEKEKLKKAFIALLKEQKHLHRHSSWTETKRQIDTDSRYKGIESSGRREDYFRDYIRYLDEKPADTTSSSETTSSDRRDRKRDGKSSRSGRHEDSSSEARNKDSPAVSGIDSESGAIEDTDEDNAVTEEERRREKEKQERIEASLASRNKEVKEQLSKYQNEREKERDQLKLDESIECFKAMLLDLIKPNTVVERESSSSSSSSKSKSDSADGAGKDGRDGKTTRGVGEMSWKDAKKILKRDSRWSYCKVLEKERKEELFDEHIEKLRAKKREVFYQLLDDTSGVTLSSTWKEVKKLIKADARYEKLQQSDSIKMEKEFDNYINEQYQTAKRNFQELLLQTKLITYKSYELIKEGPAGQTHIKEIEDILAQSKSWIVMECAADERKKLLDDYILKLHEEGPPPPPTATEPVRRK